MRQTTLGTDKDPIRIHRDNCPDCQKGNYCKVSHDLLLKEVDYKPREKKDENKTC